MRDKLAIVGIVLVVVLIAVLPIYGYVNNIVELCHCDFQSPMKAEVVRGVGIVIPIVGVVAGYIEINDDPIEKGTK
jgi:hypothetical protein